MKTKREWQDEWFAALRSGKYTQATDTLFDKDCNGYCCLGVAARLVRGPDEKILGTLLNENYADVKEAFGFRGTGGELGEAAVYFNSEGHLIDYEDYDGDSFDEAYDDLAELNDSLRWTFEQIADYAEANRDKIFTP